MAPRRLTAMQPEDHADPVASWGLCPLFCRTRRTRFRLAAAMASPTTKLNIALSGKITMEKHGEVARRRDWSVGWRTVQ